MAVLIVIANENNNCHLDSKAELVGSGFLTPHLLGSCMVSSQQVLGEKQVGDTGGPWAVPWDPLAPSLPGILRKNKERQEEGFPWSCQRKEMDLRIWKDKEGIWVMEGHEGLKSQ